MRVGTGSSTARTHGILAARGDISMAERLMAAANLPMCIM